MPRRRAIARRSTATGSSRTSPSGRRSRWTSAKSSLRLIRPSPSLSYEGQQPLDADRIDQQQAEHQARALRPAELVLVAEHPGLERPADLGQLGDREPPIAVRVGEPPGERDAVLGRPLPADRPGGGHEPIEGGRRAIDPIDALGRGRRRRQRQRADQERPDAGARLSVHPRPLHQCVRPSRVVAPTAAAPASIGAGPGQPGLSPRE